MISKLSRIGLILLLPILSSCSVSNFFLGKENLAEPVELPSNPNALSLNSVWNQSLGNGTSGKELKLTPLITSDSVFIASYSGLLASFNRENGDKNWKINIENNIVAGVAGDDGVIVVGTENGALLAYNAADGKYLWRYQLSTEILANPVAVKNILVARAIDGQITAIDIKTGNSIWKSDIAVANLTIRGNSSPVYLDGMLLITDSTGRLTVLNIVNGQQIFSNLLAVGRGKTEVERIVDMVSTPTISNGIFYASAYLDKTMAINLHDGKLVWQSKLYDFSDLYVDDNNLYLADKNSIITAVDKTTGKPVWTSKVLEGHRISPISGDGKIILAIDQTGILAVLDASDGKLMFYKSIADSKSFVAPMRMDDKWVTYTTDGRLKVFNLESK